jgi:hypothetical protein
MYYTSQLIGGWISREINTYQYLKIDLEGLWEINSIAIKDMSSGGWNSYTFRYIMTTFLSLKNNKIMDPFFIKYI